MNRFLLYPLLLLVAFTARLSAQVNINFDPVLNGQTLDGLAMVQVFNGSQGSMSGSFRISVRDALGRLVLNISVPQVTIQAGNNRLQKSMLGNSAIKFGESQAVPMLSQTGRFPEGEYEYCFQFLRTSYKPDPEIFENCFQQTILPAMPLLLIDPYNGDEICNTRPGFSWQPPVPLIPDVRYRIVVVPVYDKQDAMEALVNNRPVINMAGLRQQFINYPPQTPDLVKGQQYAWQVLVHKGDIIVTKSEVWQFTVKCDTLVNEQESYREAKVALEGSYYLAKQVLHFSFTNPYKSAKLDYTIIDLADPLTEIKKLPRVHMKSGINLIDLHLENNPSFIADHHYLLRIRNAGTKELVLKFSYAK